MTKLKTLKDIPLDAGTFTEHEVRRGKVDAMARQLLKYKQELRAEAIVDIKRFILEKAGKTEWCFLNYQASEQEYDAIITYIKWKFNITEEDLK